MLFTSSSPVISNFRTCFTVAELQFTLIREGAIGAHLHPVSSRMYNGLPLWHGSQIAVDTTLVSPLGRTGSPHRECERVGGRALQRARRKKEISYPELLPGPGRRARLVVMAVEVGGRWSEETASFLRLLSQARARSAPAHLRSAAEKGWLRRWSAMFACTVANAFAASLSDDPLHGLTCVDGNVPSLSEILSEARWSEPPSVSRMPLRP